MNAIVFSQCKLLSFSFECIFNHIFNTQIFKEVTVETYDVIDSFVSAISQNTKLVLVDITSIGCIDAYTLLKKIRKKSRVIVLCDNKTNLCILPDYYNAILYKTTSILNIIATIERVCDRKYNDLIVDLDSDCYEIPVLTKKEQETLKLITFGLSNDQIAELLSTTHKKIIEYRSNICRKYNVNSLDISYYKHI
ncbi:MULTISPECIES: helix-turn-helix transcriptional regulator [Yersinia]|jgi:DNA-binding NarL/FixJ family response regulator|uniref:Two component system sensor kinase SsrB n=1 Tax=Yersinia intermedia TaxID=631 RepID=A0A0T9N3W5_YERIN|nr:MULTISPECIES: LuxR C-terminal-related transcriptional regulator [Yersinia]AJJ20601.1 bacterial regulatory s, luxR family protein [Yersinia intermedia]ARB86392.1 DNA-binding response regulator [Yersinia sp. FDAARGOS_228]AVL36248.1 DNA-binding response regulator [Yersinia intermedia]MCB5300298.1 LuxR C-terminal-related transcriptional regulator [Yersinia intermedia]MDN0117206.1 LuxR C-terminal-related transcriptional regulator [Yersinia intermedia]